MAASTIEPNGMFRIVRGKGAEITAEYLPSASETSLTERVVSRYSVLPALLTLLYVVAT